MLKGEKLTPEQIQKLKAGKRSFEQAILDGLDEIITNDEIEYSTLHHKLNSWLTNRLGRKVDIEYMQLGAGLRVFGKTHTLTWREERSGAYQGQRKSFVKLTPPKCVEVDNGEVN